MQSTNSSSIPSSKRKAAAATVADKLRSRAALLPALCVWRRQVSRRAAMRAADAADAAPSATPVRSRFSPPGSAASSDPSPARSAKNTAAAAPTPTTMRAAAVALLHHAGSRSVRPAQRPADPANGLQACVDAWQGRVRRHSQQLHRAACLTAAAPPSAALRCRRAVREW